MPSSREDLRHRDTSHANEPRIHLELKPKDAETLMKLQDAGVIDIPGLDLAEDDPRLVEWTYDEYIHYMRFERRHTVVESTAKQYASYLRFLEDPASSRYWTEDFDPPPPLQLRPPREEDWKDIISHYILHGKDGKTLNNHRRALKPLLRFLGLPMWQSLVDGFPEADAERVIPTKDRVPEFWTRSLSDDPYMEKLWKAVFHFNFHAGVRPPSELCDMELEKVDWDRNRITYWEEKKDNWRYDVPFEPFLINGTNCPSLRWYVDHVRPMVDTGKSDALFLAPNGKKWVHGTFRQKMSAAGKQVWAKFIPYCTRHWVAVQFLIANDYNVYATAKRLGDTVAVVERSYLPHAEARADLDRRFSMPRFRKGTQ